MFCLVGCLFYPPTAAAEPVLCIEYHDFWPFYTRGTDGHMTGFAYEMVTEALGRIGVEACWESYPWSRAQARVKAGEADALVTVPTPERLRYAVTHPDPIYMKGHDIFTYAAHPKLELIKSIKSIDDIHKAGLTVITYQGNGWNDKNIRSRGIKTYDAPKLKSVWMMLANHRGDIIIEWAGAVWPLVEEAGLDGKLVEVGVSLDPTPFHLLIGKGSSFVGILSRFNEVLKEMRADGTMDEIMGRYVRRR
ncbi:ABC transporter substrate-binding protein [Pseudodesulfovibrio sp. S3]|nr:ABC transporter substrate-binding protein [Pseudodesulfovibrio sp. S3]